MLFRSPPSRPSRSPSPAFSLTCREEVTARKKGETRIRLRPSNRTISNRPLATARLPKRLWGKGLGGERSSTAKQEESARASGVRPASEPTASSSIRGRDASILHLWIASGPGAFLSAQEISLLDIPDKLAVHGGYNPLTISESFQRDCRDCGSEVRACKPAPLSRWFPLRRPSHFVAPTVCPCSSLCHRHRAYYHL